MDIERREKEKDLKTEELILNAARKVFLQKGMDGARMQQIADEAGINKALLHYYFRSKDKLFDAIFLEAITKFVPSVFQVMDSELPLFRKIEIFVDSYINMLKQNPYIPMFILHEINRDPARIVNMFRQGGVQPDRVINRMKEELHENGIYHCNPVHLVVNMLSMCIFPFAARPILKSILFGGIDEKYEAFIDERKDEIVKFLKSALTVK